MALIDTTIVIHESMRETSDLLIGQFKKCVHDVRFSSNINFPDFMFPTIKPALAFVVVNLPKSQCDLDCLVERLKVFGNKFKNSYAIVYGSDGTDGSNSHWSDLQFYLPVGNLKMLHIPSYSIDAIVQLVLACFNSLKDQNKQRLQTKYFEDLRDNIVSVASAKAVAVKALGKLLIPSPDDILIVDALASIASLVTADGNTLSELPVEASSAISVSNFFSSPKTPRTVD